MESLFAFVPNIGIGLATALMPINLGYCILGVSVGMVIGVLPGIGPMTALSLLFPFTLYLDPTAALIMLAGIHYGASYGGSVTSILLNLPGNSSSAVATLDGYPMAQQGRAGIALFATTIASFVGGSFSILLMMMLAPLVASAALALGPADYFSLMLLGLVAAASISTGSAAKGIAMIVLGVLLGMVGRDFNTGTPRFTFGLIQLGDGISLVALAMGLFGVSEVIASARQTGEPERPLKVTFRSMIPSRDDTRRSVMPTVRGTLVGFFCGILPGLGGIIASYMAYVVEKRAALDPSRFGKGAIEGVVAPEAANNAADQASFIPTMSLGIPGSANMALLLAMLMVHGILPGPTLITDRPDMFWGLIMSFWIGNLVLLVLNIPLIGLWVRLLTVPKRVLLPTILLLVCFGVFSIDNSVFDVWMVMLFGLVGYALRLASFSAAALLLGFVLGPLMETNFKNALILSRGDLGVFVERPVSLVVLAVAAVILVWGFASPLVTARRLRSAAETPR
jgi:TctA family transporter